MREQFWLGIALLLGAPILFAILYHIGLIVNLITTIEQIIAGIIIIMVISGVGFVYNGVRSKTNETPKDPILAAKQWVQGQLVRITIEDWYNLKVETRADGNSVVTGGCVGTSSGYSLPPRYVFEVVVTNTNTVMSNESWVRKIPSTL